MLVVVTFGNVYSLHIVLYSIKQQYLANKNQHYANTPMQYTAIFHGCKNDNFQMKNCDVFLIFALNIDRGYSLEPPH